MRNYSQYWLIAKLSFITPRRISRLRLTTAQLWPLNSYLIKKTSHVELTAHISVLQANARRRNTGHYEMKDSSRGCSKAAPLSYSFCLPHHAKEHWCTKNGPVPCHVQPLRFHLRRKRSGNRQESGRWWESCRNVILHEAATQTLCHGFGADRVYIEIPQLKWITQVNRSRPNCISPCFLVLLCHWQLNIVIKCLLLWHSTST